MDLWLVAKRRKPQKVGHIPVPASRGRAPSLPATINQTHVFPRPLATTDNAETRDLVLKTRGVVRRPRTTPLRSRVCGVSLLAYDQGLAGQSLCAHPATTVGQCWRQSNAGKKTAEKARSKPPSTLHAQNSVFKNQQAITLADIDFTPILQGQSRFRAI